MKLEGTLLNQEKAWVHRRFTLERGKLSMMEQNTDRGLEQIDVYGAFVHTHKNKDKYEDTKVTHTHTVPRMQTHLHARRTGAIVEMYHNGKFKDQQYVFSVATDSTLFKVGVNYFHMSIAPQRHRYTPYPPPTHTRHHHTLTAGRINGRGAEHVEGTPARPRSCHQGP